MAVSALEALVLNNDGICANGKYYVPENMRENLNEEAESLGEYVDQVFFDEPENLTKFLMRSDKGVGKNRQCSTIPETLIPECSEVLNFMREQKCVCTGSYAATVAMRFLGLTPDFVFNDIDLFCEGQVANELEKFQVTRRTRATGYCEVEDANMLAIYDFTAGSKFQAILLRLWEKNEMIDFAKAVSDSMDFTIVSPVIYYYEGTFRIYIPNLSDLQFRRLVQKSGTRTKPGRVGKWSGRNFTKTGEFTYIEKSKVRIAPFCGLDGGELTITSHSDFVWCKNMVLYVSGETQVILSACENMEIRTINCEPEFSFEDSSVKVCGDGGNICAYSGKLEIGEATRYFFIHTNESNRTDGWYSTPYTGVTQVTGNFYPTGEKNEFVSPALPDFLSGPDVYEGLIGDLFEHHWVPDFLSDARLWKSPDYRFVTKFTLTETLKFGIPYLEHFSYCGKSIEVMFGGLRPRYSSILPIFNAEIIESIPKEKCHETIVAICKYFLGSCDSHRIPARPPGFVAIDFANVRCIDALRTMDMITALYRLRSIDGLRTMDMINALYHLMGLRDAN